MKGFLTLPSHHTVPGIHLLMQPSSLGLPSSVEAKYNAREIIIMLRIQGLYLPFFSTAYTFIILVLQILRFYLSMAGEMLVRPSVYPSVRQQITHWTRPNLIF